MKYEIKDVTWSVGAGFKPRYVTVYHDRPLRWRERLAMRFLGMPDPRVLGTWEADE